MCQYSWIQWLDSAVVWYRCGTIVLLEILNYEDVLVAVLMDWSFVHKTWEKWASTSVGSSGEPLKAALLINQDPTGPSLQNKKGIKADAIDLTEFVDFVKLNKLQTDCFVIGQKTNLTQT
ncbi:hypothetical protein WN943_007241 [Citrus x changshan-huyou]